MPSFDIHATLKWTAGDLVRAIAQVAEREMQNHAVYTTYICFTSCPLVPVLSAAERAALSAPNNLRYLVQVQSDFVFFGTRSSRGDLVVRFFVDLFTHMRPEHISMTGHSKLPACVLHAFIAASPNAAFDIESGQLPASLLRHLDAPQTLATSDAETFNDPEGAAQLTRMCTTSVMLLVVHRIDFDNGPEWRFIENIIQSDACTIKMVHFIEEGKRPPPSSRACRALLNAPKYVCVKPLNPSLVRHAIVSKEEWDAWRNHTEEVTEEGGNLLLEGTGGFSPFPSPCPSPPAPLFHPQQDL